MFKSHRRSHAAAKFDADGDRGFLFTLSRIDDDPVLFCDCAAGASTCDDSGITRAASESMAGS